MSFSEVADVDLIAQDPQVLDGKVQVELDVDVDSDLDCSASSNLFIAAMEIYDSARWLF